MTPREIASTLRQLVREAERRGVDFQRAHPSGGSGDAWALHYLESGLRDLADRLESHAL